MESYGSEPMGEASMYLIKASGSGEDDLSEVSGTGYDAEYGCGLDE